MPGGEQRTCRSTTRPKMPPNVSVPRKIIHSTPTRTGESSKPRSAVPPTYVGGTADLGFDDSPVRVGVECIIFRGTETFGGIFGRVVERHVRCSPPGIESHHDRAEILGHILEP